MKRPIRIEGEVAFVPLTQGYEAVIDAADIGLVNGVNWRAHVERRADGSIINVYAVRWAGIQNGKRRYVAMHRVIAETPDGMETDHKDANGLNNRRHNLRSATTAQNQHNARMPTHNTSGIKGVCPDRRRGNWRAQIVLSGRQIFLGSFSNIEDAAAAYAKASAKLHGEFGRAAVEAQP